MALAFVQSLLIEPEKELAFYGPFQNGALASLRLSNPTSSYVLFKVNSTSPKYTITPKNGYIMPKTTVVIEVELCSLYDPRQVHSDEFKMHKLLVVSNTVCSNFSIPSNVEEFLNKQKTNFYTILKCIFKSRSSCVTRFCGEYFFPVRSTKIFVGL